MGALVGIMTREERIAKNEQFWAVQREKEEQYKRIQENYKKLSYRDKLLFISVLNFLAENPADERWSIDNIIYKTHIYICIPIKKLSLYIYILSISLPYIYF
jgi:hypothetical protein